MSVRVFGFVVAPLRRMALALASRLSPSRRVGRVQLVDLAEDGRADERLAKLTDALDLVQRVHPWRYAQLQRHLHRVIIIARGGEMYDFDIGACLFDVPFVAGHDVVLLAGALVHEAVHARLADRGIRHCTADRARVESLTTDAQVHFLRAAGAEVLAEATIRAAEHEWWSDQAMLSRRVEQLRGYGAAPWVIRLYRRLTGAVASGRDA